MAGMRGLTGLVERWRRKADDLEPYAPRIAFVFREVADELEASIADSEEEQLRPAQAARESGYTAAHIRNLIADGTLPNVGTKERPLVRRGDLPRKPGHDVEPPAKEARKYSTREEALRAIAEGD